MANEITLNTKLLVRRDSSSNLASYKLDAGEFGYALDTKAIKMGDGNTLFNSLKTLAYAEDVTSAINAAIANLSVNASGAATSKTLTAISEENGVFTFTFADIAISQGQVSGLTDALNAKADKVTNATAGNFAVLDAEGNLTDSGKKAADFAEAKHNHEVNEIKFSDAQVAALDSGITAADVARLAEVEAGAEVNAIEKVQVNGVDLTPDASRTVNVVIPAASEYSIVKASDSGDYAAVYNLTKDGKPVGASINIPKDIVVKSGSVIGDEIVLVLNDEDETEIKIPVGSLIEYVTSGSAAGDMVVIAVDETTHKVTATITDGTITLAKLASDVQTKINQAHSHANKTELDLIVNGDKSKWDTAAGKAHEHGNKDLLDTYDQTNVDIKDAVSKRHSHSFTDTDVNDAISRMHAHENSAIIDAITAEDVSAWNGKLSNLESLDNTIEVEATSSTVLSLQVNKSNAAGNIITKKDDGIFATVVAGTTDDNDVIAVTTDSANGIVTITHKDYTTGAVVIKDANGQTPEVPYFFNALAIENGHVTGATAQSLADALRALSLILDGGNAQA